MIADSRIVDIATQYGTPLYIYDRSVIKENIESLRTSLYPGATLCYAMKCNPLMGICEVFRNEGLSIEVASAGEMNVALGAGYDGCDITFTSPGKTHEEIEFAIKNNVKLINIETMREAHIVDEIAGALGRIQKIGIRVNPSVCFSNAKIKMSGVSSQFGIEEEDLNDAFFEELKSLRNIEIAGIQVYMGTQMLLSTDILKNTEYIIELGIRLSSEYGFTLKYLNCGGGFGVKYFKNETELDMDALKDGMSELHKRFGDKLTGTEVIFESGRFLMATAGVMATKVLYTKESKGMKYVICDGGSNIHSSAAFLGRFVRNNFPMHTIPDTEDKQVTTICGPLCTSLDVIGQKVEVSSSLAENDMVVIEMSGAYGYTYSPNRFLSHESPAEVLSDGDSTTLLRKRGNRNDYLDGQLLL